MSISCRLSEALSLLMLHFGSKQLSSRVRHSGPDQISPDYWCWMLTLRLSGTSMDEWLGVGQLVPSALVDHEVVQWLRLLPRLEATAMKMRCGFKISKWRLFLCSKKGCRFFGTNTSSHRRNINPITSYRGLIQAVSIVDCEIACYTSVFLQGSYVFPKQFVGRSFLGEHQRFRSSKERVFYGSYDASVPNLTWFQHQSIAVFIPAVLKDPSQGLVTWHCFAHRNCSLKGLSQCLLLSTS